MPNTRASARRIASKRKLKKDTATSDDDMHSSVRHVREDIEVETDGMSIMDNLREARSGVGKLYTQIRSLEQENEKLRSRLQRNVSGDASRSSDSRERPSQRRIRSLEQRIVDLKAAREKDRRIIKKLRETEVERDAKELTADHDEAVPTRGTGDNAIRLLRRMCGTIDMNTLAEGEECAICVEEMAVGKCYSLPCQHPVCVGCFERLSNSSDGSDTLPNDQTGSVQCPHCRKICPRDECEIITHTAVQQWDLLLDISQQWAATDAGDIDIGEDDEDSFIDDSSGVVADSPCGPDSLGETMDPDPEVFTVSTPVNGTRPVTYKNLPSPMKRKRLTELVAQRAGKRSVVRQ